MNGIQRFLFFLTSPWLKKRGFGAIGGRRVFILFYNDLLHYRKTSLKQKVWAYRRGFISERIERYGLTNENVKEYMPDAHYYMLKAHLNSPLGNWFDNKLTTRFLLRAFDEYMEDYYLFLKGGRMIKLMDFPMDMVASPDGIADWVREMGPLAAKAIKGSLGSGFLRLGYEKEQYFVDRTPHDIDAFKTVVAGLNGYAIVGYLKCHADLRKVHDRSANALRVMTAFDYDLGRAVVTGAHMRFGTDKSGYLEHVIHGGILAGVDVATGKMYRALAFRNGKYVEIQVHPDTGVEIAGAIPGWDFIVNKALEISDALPVTPHLTFDIIVTDDGFRVLEINSHSDISNIQIYYPYFQSDAHRKLFAGLVQ